VFLFENNFEERRGIFKSRHRTDNAIAKRKRTKAQILVDKILNKKLV
jgi:hypothetical protein